MYVVIKDLGHLRALERCERHSHLARDLCISISQMPVVGYVNRTHGFAFFICYIN